ncbi:site-specific integrase [Rhodoferax sp.]|uniref:site-specific integrase n=1 Tax=Rhodoferax sp. TaxID=50421 RepID=UPI002848A1F6|nr:site-specific integrase [Rhodoferax sp.]MDR3370905.1 site-specific integrase [Rhodoferax sp.]
MIKIPALHLPLRDWLLEGPLSAQVPAYVARLKRGGYAPHTCERNLNALAHFAHWLVMCHLPVHMLDEGCIDHFLRYHLPCCDCLGGVLRSPAEAHAALIPLLEILRIENIAAPPFTPTGPIADELRSYETYMCEVRGLASGTRTNRLRIVERLLQSKFAGRPVDFGELQTEDVRQFIAEQLDFLGTTSNATAIASSLRAYLQYRATCGDTVQPMLAVIASPARWSMASLPRALKPEEADRLLRSFTSTLPSPRRGYAVVRLALDLGLRGIEINRLQLSDIDWLRGTITLKGTKSKRQDILPLPPSTGRALEAYLRHERPKTSDAAVFVRRMAPHDEPIGVDAIRRIVRDAFRRAEIPHGRGHALRHTVACRIVNQGGSIKEVADVLRHRSLNTSMIYAKLDHGALSGVALPWPGSPE